MDIPVFGMTCAKCEAKVQAAVVSVVGVSDVRVNRLENLVQCAADSTLRANIEKSILEAGYSVEKLSQNDDGDEGERETRLSNPQVKDSKPLVVNSDIKTLEVGGMSCASCVAAVERALDRVAGAEKVEVNYALGTAQVVGQVEIAELIRAVQQAGYSAREADQDTPKSIELKRALTLNVLRSMLALIPAALLMFSPEVLPNLLGWVGVGILVFLILFITGGRYYRASLSALRHGRATMDTLVSLGTGSAWLFSMLVLLAPEFVSENSQHLFFEAALFIIGFVHLGKSIEEYARGQASDALGKLLDLSPKFANRLNGIQENKVPIMALSQGDVLIIRAGEAVPVDGTVTAGSGSVDEQMVTGEPLPVFKQTGDQVTGGTINLVGTLTITVTKVGDNTVLGRMVRAVQQAQNSKPPLAHLADEISAWFVPVVILLASCSAAAWWLNGAELQFVLAIFMTTLVVACPCALGLAIPMSVIVGLGRAANLGFLVRHSDSLQTTAKVNMFVLDKTGTLTEGRPRVAEIVVADGADKQMLSGIALSLELNSIHPLAAAVQTVFADSTHLPLHDVKTHAGLGVTAIHEDELCVLGNAKFLVDLGYDDFPGEVPELGSLVYVGLGGRYLGVLSIQDTVRPDAAMSIQQVKALGIKPLLLSGDREQVVAHVAKSLEIEDYRGGLTPEEKQSIIASYQQSGYTVAMVGDGINDALALSQADVGIAMGAGSDIAIESADVTLMRHELSLIADVVKLSSKVVINIKQNLGAAFIYNVCLIPIAAGALYPFAGTLLDPSLAGMAMALSSISVVANAARLRLVA
jgi:Cu+-exporting ATPase